MALSDWTCIRKNQNREVHVSPDPGSWVYTYTNEDSPSTTESLVDDGHEWQTENGAEGVRGGDETVHLSLWLAEIVVPRVKKLHGITAWYVSTLAAKLEPP
jgi:hypothetical protein